MVEIQQVQKGIVIIQEQSKNKLVQKGMDINMKNIALITGASSGMGREFAKIIDQKLTSIDEIWIVARRAQRLETLSEELSKDSKIIVGDLSDLSGIDIIEQELLKEKPNVKMLVNCAGFGKIGHVDKSDVKEQSDMVSLNCTALTRLTRVALDYMDYNSRIINIASVAAFIPQPDFAVYAASKSYVLSFSRALNSELKSRDIYVTAVCPGPADTEFFDIAETQKGRVWYKNMFMVKCENVVKQAFYDSIHKKEMSIYGIPMKALYVVSKIIPHRFLIAFIGSH